MSKYNDLKELAANQNDTEKLATLRHEMIMPISTIQGYSHLLKGQITSSQKNVAEQVIWLEEIIDSVDSLKEILEAITGAIDV